MIALCERFGCLPSQLLAEDTQLLKWLRIQHLGGSNAHGGGVGVGAE